MCEFNTLNLSDSYAYIFIVLFLATWYASIAPVGILLALLGFFCNYWIDKIKLIKF